MRSVIRLIIADDHAVFRQGLRLLLALQDDIEIVAEVDRAERLLPVLTATPCDVLLLDLQMDRWVVEEIEQLARLTWVCVLTASERIEDAMAALRMGARAIVQKRFAVETLTAEIRTVADGLVWVPPMLQAELAAQMAARGAKRLTVRELISSAMSRPGCVMPRSRSGCQLAKARSRPISTRFSRNWKFAIASNWLYMRCART